MVVTITHNGYVKRVPIKAYEKQKRGGKGKVAVTTHDDDFIEKFFVSILMIHYCLLQTLDNFIG